MSRNDAQDKAIKTAKNRECNTCSHKIDVDQMKYCELWVCDYEPKENADAYT